MSDRKALTDRFVHKPGQWKNQSTYEAIESKFQFLAAYIDEFLPNCAEKDEAFNRLLEALMWTRQGIERCET
jgi:hypothetical protein